MSLWVKICCLTCISIVDLIVTTHVVVGQEGCEKVRTCQGLAQIVQGPASQMLKF